MTFDQVGQFEVLEHELQEFFLGNLEDEVVHALAGVAGLAAAAATASAALRPGDVFTGGELLVAWVHDGLFAPATMVQHRFVDIAPRNADLLAMFHVHDGTAAYRLFDGLLDMFAVPPQEALAVDRALVLAVQASIYNVAHGPSGSWEQLHASSYELLHVMAAKQLPPPKAGSSLGRAVGSLSLYCDFLTRRYHSDSRRTCLSV